MSSSDVKRAEKPNEQKKKNLKGNNRKNFRKRRNNRRKKKATSKNATAVINKKLRVKFEHDVRGPNAIMSGFESRLLNPTIPISVPVDVNTFTGPILGVVSYAITRGWSLFTTDDSYPYWAWMYQSYLLIQASQGGIPATGNIPRWLSYLIQAVIKKTVNYRGGSVSYNFDVSGTQTTDYIQPIGPSFNSRHWNLGVKSSNLVNTMIPVITDPAAYDLKKGEEATQHMWLFLQKNDLTHNPKSQARMHEMIPFNEANIMTKDISAYAQFEIAPGGGYRGTGGWFKQIYNEIGVTRPVFSCFSPIVPNIMPLNRSRLKLRLGSGDAVMLGGILASTLDSNNLSYKTPVAIKYIDFWEFFDVLARALRFAAELRTETDEFVANYANNNNYFNENIQCPLTIQQVALLLRATMSTVFTENFMLQGSFPRYAVNVQDNEFVVFPISINTYPIQYSNSMLLPKMLQENILALKGRTLMNGLGGSRNPIMLKPALGAYASDQFVRSDFVVEYTIDNAPKQGYLFADDANETHIDIIDGHYTGNNGSSYACINDPSFLNQLGAIWNEWIQSMGDHLRMLGSISNSNGIDCLACIQMTSHWTPVADKKKKKKSKKSDDDCTDEEPYDVVTKKLSKRLKNISVGPYASRKLITITSASSIIDDAWTSFQQYFVLPINKFETINNLRDATNPLTMAGYLREPRNMPAGAGTVRFMTISDRNENFAALLTKTKFAQDTSYEKLMAKFEQEGQGGILGQLTQVLTGTIGHAAVDVGSKLLGNAIPI
jgi:hypothetical protein